MAAHVSLHPSLAQYRTLPDHSDPAPVGRGCDHMNLGADDYLTKARRKR